MDILNWDQKAAFDMRPRPVLRLSLEPDVPVTDEQKRCFEVAKKALLDTPYFCSWSERQIAEYLLVHLDKLRVIFDSGTGVQALPTAKNLGCCSWNDDI
jgi:hypothetical protein